MKKQLVALLLCVVMAVSVCACGNGSGEGTEAQGTEKLTGQRTTVAENIAKPSVTEMPSYNPTEILTGDYEITQEDVEQYMYSVLADKGLTLQEVTDRPIQAGDIVNVDYTGYLDGEAFSGGSATDQYLDVGKNGSFDLSTGESMENAFIDGFTSGLLGADAKAGTKVSSEVTFPDPYKPNTDMSGKVTTFEFVINGVYTLVPVDQITDAQIAEKFAESREVSTMAELRLDCEEYMGYYYTINYLMNNVKMDIPEEYLNARLELYYNYMVEYYNGEENLEKLVAQTGYTMDAMKVMWLQEIESLVKEETLFAEIAKQANLTVDTTWYDNFMENYTTSYIAYWGETYTDLEPEFVETMYLKQYGVGDTEAAYAYMLNQRAVVSYLEENYRASK